MSNPADLDAIALVAMLPHRVGTRRTCKCDECRAIRRVVALAREAASRKKAQLPLPSPRSRVR